MTEKEYYVEKAKSEVCEAESRLREAEHNRDHGFKLGTAKVEQAKLEAAKDNARLKEEVERCKSKLHTEMKWLELREDELEKGFEE